MNSLTDRRCVLAWYLLLFRKTTTTIKQYLQLNYVISVLLKLLQQYQVRTQRCVMARRFWQLKITAVTPPRSASYCVLAFSCSSSTSSMDYSLPRLRTKFGERAFTHAGPATWNALPDNIRTVADPVNLRKLLKSHYFSQAFNIC